MIRILLIGPIDPAKPSDLKLLTGGETTFVKTLFENAPNGVEFVHHSKAFVEGEIAHLWLDKLLSFLVKLRILPVSSGTFAIKLNSHFDIIHCHGYSIKIKDPNVPIILSDSSSNYLFLRDYLRWPKWRIEIGFKLRRWLFGRMGVIDPDTNFEKASKLIVFSEFAKKIHQRLGTGESKLEVIYPGIAATWGDKEDGGNKGIVRVLFVGTWFERKGGTLVLEAFEKLADKYPQIKLTIIGPIGDRIGNYESRIKNRIDNYDYVPREKLMRDFFPKADIFVLVPPKVEGFGFTVLEAMSYGIPTIVSNVCALPELVENGKNGFVIKPGSLKELTNKLEILIRNKTLRQKMGEAARKRFEEKFSIEKSNERLLKIYQQALL